MGREILFLKTQSQDRRSVARALRKLLVSFQRFTSPWGNERQSGLALAHNNCQLVTRDWVSYRVRPEAKMLQVRFLFQRKMRA